MHYAFILLDTDDELLFVDVRANVPFLQKLVNTSRH